MTVRTVATSPPKSKLQLAAALNDAGLLDGDALDLADHVFDSTSLDEEGMTWIAERLGHSEFQCRTKASKIVAEADAIARVIKLYAEGKKV